jgi:hypothetical protein
MSYGDDINIDEDGLDVEWINHSRLMMKYCRKAAEAHRDMDLAKERLDLARATLDQAIRSDPKAYGITAEKPTEASINAAILMNVDYQTASTAYIDAKFENNVANDAVRAFDHRKSALENLVRLHGQSYFAGPAIPRNLHDERLLKDKTAQAKVQMK